MCGIFFQIQFQHLVNVDLKSKSWPSIFYWTKRTKRLRGIYITNPIQYTSKGKSFKYTIKKKMLQVPKKWYTMIYHIICRSTHILMKPLFRALGFFGDVWVRPRNSRVRRPLGSELSDFTEESKDHLVMALASELRISSRPRPQQTARLGGRCWGWMVRVRT